MNHAVLQPNRRVGTVDFLLHVHRAEQDAVVFFLSEAFNFWILYKWHNYRGFSPSSNRSPGACSRGKSDFLFGGFGFLILNAFISFCLRSPTFALQMSQILLLPSFVNH